MPRKARIDAAGALHHIIIRGIEGRKIFRGDEDLENFLDRLAGLLPKTQTRCFAWALLPNHAHLLLQTGVVPIASLMRRLLTGYAVFFNLRYYRHGHLFQNRYKSILCQEDTYLKELVRYIHLNPLRAGLVADLKSNRTGRTPTTFWPILVIPVLKHGPLTAPLWTKEFLREGAPT
jgi:putative transposase